MVQITKEHRSVCHISTAHEASATRIFHKEAKSLLQAGYKVVIIAQAKKTEIVDGIKIIALPTPRNRIDRFLKLGLKMLKLARKENADVYHFHDPELIGVGLILKLFGKKVIYDVHELVYYNIADKKWLKFGFFIKLVQFVYFIFESISVNVFDQLILAEQSYEDYYNERYKKFKNYTIVRNMSILSFVDSPSRERESCNGKPVIVYVGGLSKVRGITQIIESMELIGGRAELHLIGKWASESYRQECEALAGFKYVKYLGFMSLNQVYDALRNSDIGICILYPIKNYVETTPVKAFEYMSCSLPMVMSNFPYWEKFFGECAVFADPYNSQHIADKIQFLLEHPEDAKRLGNRGKELVFNEYNWEIESKKLIKLYNELLE